MGRRMSELFEIIDERPGPARPIPALRAQALVRGTISHLLVGQPVPPPRRSPLGQRLVRVAIVVLGSLATGVVVASLATTDRWPGVPAPPAPESREAPEPPPSNLPETTSAPTVTAPAASTAHELRAPGRAHATGRRQRPVVKVADAQDALMLANRLRLQRQWRLAADAYKEIALRFSGTDTAYVALVARGQLLLDHLDESAAALTLFRQALALRPDGPLTEEARYNIAVHYRIAGDVKNERVALEQFLNVQQSNPRRAAAAARLMELQP